MNDTAATRSLPNPTGIVAASLVALGVFLWMFSEPGLLVIAGLGAFGPGVLRELGVLRDHDEFQRQAAHRAGYHAYLIGGSFAVLVVSWHEWTQTDLELSGDWLGYILVVLWLSWLFSSVMGYWGAQKTTSRILLAVGLFWAAFGLAHVVGAIVDPEPISDYGEFFQGVTMVTLLIVPWFVLAWTVNRWPRGTGIALLVMAAVLMVVFNPLGPSQIPFSSQIMTTTLLVGPFLACGVALLRETREEADNV